MPDRKSTFVPCPIPPLPPAGSRRPARGPAFQLGAFLGVTAVALALQFWIVFSLPAIFSLAALVVGETVATWGLFVVGMAFLGCGPCWLIMASMRGVVFVVRWFVRSVQPGIGR